MTDVMAHPSLYPDVNERAGRTKRSQRAALLDANSDAVRGDDRSSLGERLQFGEGEIARDAFHAAIRGQDQPLGREVLERCADAGGDHLRGLRLGVAHANDTKDHGLVAEPVERREVGIGLGGFDRDLLYP